MCCCIVDCQRRLYFFSLRAQAIWYAVLVSWKCGPRKFLNASIVGWTSPGFGYGTASLQEAKPSEGMTLVPAEPVYFIRMLRTRLLWAGYCTCTYPEQMYRQAALAEGAEPNGPGAVQKQGHWLTASNLQRPEFQLTPLYPLTFSWSFLETNPPTCLSQI